jgi:hypothetical protein
MVDRTLISAMHEVIDRSFSFHRNQALRIGVALAVATTTLTPNAAQAAQLDAEYAVRWDPRRGGPATPEEALRELQLRPSEPSRFEVQYFDFTQPAGVPPGFDAILRKRISGGEAELTFKLRGTAPLPATPSLKNWPCPLGKTNDRKDEADVTFIEGGQVLKAFSRSCDVNSHDLGVQPPDALHARLKGCKSTMTRLRSGKLKVEQWQLADGSTLLEASRPGRHDDGAQHAFEREVLQPLMRLKVQPLNRSKSAIGGDC